MSVKQSVVAMVALSALAASTPASAFFFILPIPNLAKPPALNALIDALEKSEETKAVAYVSEDKLFGAKYWVWGHHSGHFPQAEADRVALSKCQAALANSKSQTAGGKPLYDYGTKSCELYSFENKTVSARAHEWQPTPTAQSPQPAPTAAPPASTQQPIAAPQPANPPSPPASAAPQTDAAPKTDPAQSSPPSQTQPQAAAPQPQNPPPSTSTDSPIAKRLRELETLRKDGLITEAEYQEKRKAILATL